MAEQIKYGDCVALKTGGPPMQVASIYRKGNDQMVGCVWFEPDKGRREETFVESQLRTVPPSYSHTFSREYSNASTVYGSFSNLLRHLTHREAQDTLEKLTEAMSFLNRFGYGTEFVTGDQVLHALPEQTAYRPGEISIVRVFQFEGFRNMDDVSVLYALKTTDGVKGWIADAVGRYANPSLAMMLLDMKDERVGLRTVPDQ